MTVTPRTTTADDEFVAVDRASYRCWSREILRYSDLDPVGHVNNNAYGQFIENARTILFSRIDARLRTAGETVPRFDWVVRRIEYDYLREVRFPGEVEVGLAVTCIGNSSMIMRHGVFTGDGCAATSSGVSVCFDLDKRSAMPIPENVRKVIWAEAGID